MTLGVIFALLAFLNGQNLLQPPMESPFSEAVAVALPRVVKLTGAAVGTQKGYGSGVIVRADGRIVTALTPLLEAANLRVTLGDGRELSAKLVARDEQRQLALLEIDAGELPYFDLADAGTAEVGDWMIAASNPFKVAAGAEPVTIAVGVCAGRAPLAGRFRRQEVPYRGDVILTDVIVSAPGCAGGALVDVHGRFVGLIGRPVIGAKTNTWLNYAYPADAVRDFVENGPLPPSQEQSLDAGAAQQDLLVHGLRLFDIGGAVRPAYVERVAPATRAARAGVRANDLILEVAGAPVATCADVYAAWARAHRASAVELIVKRGPLIERLLLTPERVE